jgi:ribosomal protein S18 acetylase RimI-like enzyme
MSEAQPLREITVRDAIERDAPGIARAFLDSAEHHAQLDPARYFVPGAEAITHRYRNRQQHPADKESATLVAELDGNIVGFIDARLEQFPDPMHRPIVYCYVSEIAVTSTYRSQGIGALLLKAGEDWGRRRGARFALLEYHPANVRAGAFYERRMGYSVASITVIKHLCEESPPSRP